MTATITIPNDLIGLAEAAALLPSRKPGRRLHVVTLYRWLDQGKIQGWRIGVHWFVSKADVLGLAVPAPVQQEVASRAERVRRVEQARREFRGGG